MDQHQAFEERLARIGRGGQPAPAPVAAEHQPVAPQMRVAVKAKPINDWRENIRYPMRFVLAFVIGGFGVILARYVRFHVNGGALTGEGADAMMLLDGGMALAVGFGLTMLFRLEAKEFKAAQTVGVLAMVAIMHNFVHQWPAAFSLVFSEEWVAQVTENTLPNSILFRGNTFVLGAGAAASGDAPPEMPTRLKLDSEK